MALWTPANLNDGSLELWFDANNSGSLSLTGSNVNSWTDLANGVVATETAAFPTFATNVQNGLPGIDFASASNARLTATTTHANFNNAMSAFAVVNLPAASYASVFGGAGTISSNPQFAFIAATPEIIGTMFNSTDVRTGSMTLAAGTCGLAGWTMPGISGGSWGPGHDYVNGTAGTGISAQTGFAFTQTGINVGNDNTGHTAGVGRMHELVILNLLSSTISRQLIEGYLAWKWGIQASLPGGHPYASAAPTLPSNNPFVNEWTLFAR